MPDTHTAVPASLPHFWKVPYQQNPFFTGREEVLTYLHDQLRVDKTVALVHPQALSGLGGIGKTQTAVEYIYRYAADYPEAVLWIRADSPEMLITDVVSTAELLNLPEKEEQDLGLVVAAVKRWLKEHSHWLLVLDNVADFSVVSDFLPTAYRGHILLTTRAHAVQALATSVKIENMVPDVGALLLLRRAGMILLDASLDAAAITDREYAQTISHLLDGLPLALDQAGAYIGTTGCSLSTYLDLYQTQRARLLKERGIFDVDHPASVVTTFTLSFRQVQQASRVAAELLRCCAFLYPEAIPEEIITQGAADLSPLLQRIAVDPLKLDSAFKELLKYSLVQRDADQRTFTIHRLVQAVLRDRMRRSSQRQRAQRVVFAVNRVFPAVDVATWSLCQRYLPHAQECASHIAHWQMESLEAARLLNQAGSYLRERAQYPSSEPLLQRALAICERVFGPEHPYTATNLDNLAGLYYTQGRYEQAEALYQRALSIDDHIFGGEHPTVATDLNNLAALYYAQGKYEQAESLLQRALTIQEQALGPYHPDVANSLSNLGEFYRAQGKYEQAEPLYQSALTIAEQAAGPVHPLTATALNNLALLYKAQGKYEQAEPLYQRALAICEQVLGPEHPNTLSALENYAVLLWHMKREDEAREIANRVNLMRAKNTRRET